MNVLLLTKECVQHYDEGHNKNLKVENMAFKYCYHISPAKKGSPKFLAGNTDRPLVTTDQPF